MLLLPNLSFDSSLDLSSCSSVPLFLFSSVPCCYRLAQSPTQFCPQAYLKFRPFWTSTQAYFEVPTFFWSCPILLSRVPSLHMEVINTELFVFDHYTCKEIFEVVTKVLPQLQQHMPLSVFGGLVKNCGLGKERIKRLNGRPIRGRPIYRLIDSCATQLVEQDSHFRDETNKSDQTIPVGLHLSITQVWAELIASKPASMGELNSRILSADPGSLVPICVAILNIYKQYGVEEHEEPVRTYGFPILPVPSTHRRFISLVPENVKKRAGHNDRISRQDGPSFLQSYRILYDVFQFRKFGIASFEDFLARHGAGRPMFYGYILTDVVSLNFVFARTTTARANQRNDIKPPQPMFLHACVLLSQVADSYILARDFWDNNDIALVGCKGNAQDMVDMIAHSTKNIRFCVIFYAGLSDDPNDVYLFLKSCKMVKAVVVDLGHKIESIPRHSLLHGKKEPLQLFKSRTGCVKRAA
ncbi:hypothetical protein [Absidia glauca]|uniref:Uncharacterized protein n=1 Tax=Absidia glauca TaxID=4829 RepID=A0A163JXZ6_ABSGL|nr:hypothetical protein [Absidia glauca]